MLTSKEIRSTTFVTVRKGYAIEDVDAFLNKFAGEIDALQNECAAMLKEKDDNIERLKKEQKELEDKMMVLADKVEEYRNQENILHNAFINAEKMKESVLQEANQTSEILLRDATQKAERIIATATGRVAQETENYENLRKEVANFKASILDVFQNHLGIITSLPDYVSDEDLNKALEASSEEVAPVMEETEEAISEENMNEESPEVSDPVEDLLDEAEKELNSSDDISEEEADESSDDSDNEDSEEFGEKFSF